MSAADASCAAMVLGDVLRDNAARFGDRVAFVGPDGTSRTFAAFNSRVNRLASALAAHGVTPGERIAILSRNRIEYFEIYGAAKAGFIVIPLNWRLTADELAHQLTHGAPSVVFADAEHLASIATLAPGLPHIRTLVALDGAHDGWIDYETLLAEGDDREPAAIVTPRDPLCLLYTSGTTGRPKGAALGHGALMANAKAFIEALDLDETDVTLAAMPLFHVGGMWYHAFPSFAAGATTHVRATFVPSEILRTIAARRITNLHLVPTMIAALLEVPDRASLDLGSLRLMFYAASSIPTELLRRAMAAFGSGIFLQSYGSTESGGVAVLTPADHLAAVEPGNEHRLTCCGRAMPGCDIRITDADGIDMAAGEVGDIRIISRRTMLGYWDPDIAAPIEVEGWLAMGDLGRLDADGYLAIVDRRNDMIVTGGENVYPREVEDALFRDPDIQEAAVFGVPDPRWVEIVAAAIVLRPGATASADAIIARARAHLAGYKCPKTIFFVEDLPKSPVGKVLKKDLRRRFGAASTGTA